MGSKLLRPETSPQAFNQTFSFFNYCPHNLNKVINRTSNTSALKTWFTGAKRTKFFKRTPANFFSDIAKKALESITVLGRDMAKASPHFIRLSLSLLKLFFPHPCKNIFVHYIEKTNLLF